MKPPEAHSESPTQSPSHLSAPHATEAGADHGISDDQKEKLFEEQRVGYEKSRKLSSAHCVDLEDAEPKIVTLAELQEVYGREQVEQAVKGGRIILLCSDDRVIAPDAAEGELPWVKFGIPGCGALFSAKDRPGFLAHLKQHLNGDLHATSHHECCGACKGDLHLAEQVGREAHDALGQTLPHYVEGYSEHANPKMTGNPKFHEGLGFVISAQPQLNTAALGMERHMHIGASAFEDDAALNGQIQALIGILRDHGWGDAGFAERPLQIKVVGNADDPTQSAQVLWKRLESTRLVLAGLEHAFREQHKDDALKNAKLFEVVLMDAPHKRA